MLLKIIYSVVLGIIIGGCRSLIKNDYYLDLPRIEREENGKLKRIYVGSLITFIVLSVILCLISSFAPTDKIAEGVYSILIER